MSGDKTKTLKIELTYDEMQNCDNSEIPSSNENNENITVELLGVDITFDPKNWYQKAVFIVHMECLKRCLQSEHYKGKQDTRSASALSILKRMKNELDEDNLKHKNES